MAEFSLDPIKDAFKQGIQDNLSVVGVEPDAELRDYKALQPEDFKRISLEVGMGRVAEYIEEMEKRKLKR